MVIVLNKIHFILLLCIVSTITFDIPFSFTNAKLNNIFTVLLVINTLVLFITKKERPKPLFAPMLGLFVGVYLMYIIGLIPTDNMKQGFFELEKKMGLLIFPLIFYYSRRLTGKEIKLILLCFVASCLLTGLISILIATYRYFTWEETKFFFYHDLSLISGMHAVYLSMYSCFSIAILLVLYLQEVRNLNWKQNLVFFTPIIFLTVFIFLLAGRTHIFLLIIGTIAFFTYRFSKNNNLLVSISRAAIIGFFIFGLAFLFPTNRERFKQAINYQDQYGLNREWGEQQMRPLIWACVFEKISNAPLFGTGTGDVQDDLQKCYIKRDYVSLLIWEPIRFNAHNQFFEITVGMGVVGLLFFLISVGVSVFNALQNKKPLYFIFLIIFIVSCLTESLLQRHSGIVFFSFFNAFLFFDSRVSPDTTFK